MHSIAGVLERHDRSRFEIAGLSIGPDTDDLMRRRVRAALDDFVDLRALDDEAAARAIHARGIDVLVDAIGYGRNARPGILALRPAPVQAGYLAYPGTSGSDFLDYYIADRYVIPPGHAVHYSERIKYLPHTYQCNDDRRPQPAAPPRAECGLPERGFVFCCFNQTYKITPEVLGIWCRLLQAVPDSVLWLWASNAAAPDNLRREALARGVAPARLVFAQTLRPAEQHRARMAAADLFLDTLPCNAHVTAADALWAGLPVLTCSGETHVGRAAGSMLRAAGIPELVTTTLAEYEARALALALDPAALAALRQRVAAGREGAPLFDTGRQTRDLEAVYEEMWGEYVRETGPSPAPSSRR
jgi:predicted O-linked N-acetylglucosamine transferase (SPINDLY family)